MSGSPSPRRIDVKFCREAKNILNALFFFYKRQGHILFSGLFVVGGGFFVLFCFLDEMVQ